MRKASDGQDVSVTHRGMVGMDVHQHETDDLLAEVNRVRKQTRRALQVLWFPLVLFGSLTLISALVSSRAGSQALGLYWLVAAPLSSVAIAVFVRRRERHVGLQLPVAPALLAVAVIFVGSFASGAAADVLDTEMLSAIGPPLFVSAGHLMFARLEHSVVVAAVATALAVTALIVAVAGTAPAPPATLLAVIYGGALLLTGGAYRLGGGLP